MNASTFQLDGAGTERAHTASLSSDQSGKMSSSKPLRITCSMPITITLATPTMPPCYKSLARMARNLLDSTSGGRGR